MWKWGDIFCASHMHTKAWMELSITNIRLPQSLSPNSEPFQFWLFSCAVFFFFLALLLWCDYLFFLFWQILGEDYALPTYLMELLHWLFRERLYVKIRLLFGYFNAALHFPYVCVSFNVVSVCWRYLLWDTICTMCIHVWVLFSLKVEWRKRSNLMKS